ncbi:hypothetical protein SCUP515_03634 [Seiridium cupressi]
MEDQAPAIQSQQVGGQSTFWVLVSLAIAAVSQPSTSSRRAWRNLFGGNIDLMRSIPGFCLYDGIVDIIALVRAMRSEISEPVTDRPAGRRERPEHKIITMKLGIFAIAVLPQTVKVLSMRGIPVTQICASAFFFAMTTRLLIEFGGWETDEYYPGATAVRVIGLLIYIGQAVLEILIWYNISLSASISMPPVMEYLWELLVDACNLMILV